LDEQDAQKDWYSKLIRRGPRKAFAISPNSNKPSKQVSRKSILSVANSREGSKSVYNGEIESDSSHNQVENVLSHLSGMTYNSWLLETELVPDVSHIEPADKTTKPRSKRLLDIPEYAINDSTSSTIYFETELEPYHSKVEKVDTYDTFCYKRKLTSDFILKELDKLGKKPCAPKTGTGTSCIFNHNQPASEPLQCMHHGEIATGNFPSIKTNTNYIDQIHNPATNTCKGSHSGAEAVDDACPRQYAALPFKTNEDHHELLPSVFLTPLIVVLFVFCALTFFV